MASKLNSQNPAHASHFFGRLLKSFVHELMLLVTLAIVIDKRTVCSNWAKLESCSKDMSEDNQQNKLDSEMALFSGWSGIMVEVATRINDSAV